jgi:NhaP-type Na+/H+ or K+/H+ antiporter
MITAGFFLVNTGMINPQNTTYKSISGLLKDAALTMIMLRAGMGLDLPRLKQDATLMLVLASVPCMVEAAAVGGAATAIFGMPFFWALLLGFLLADVSPAVTVPLLVSN